MVRSASSVEKTARLAQNTAMAKKKLAETKLNLLVKHEASQDRRRVRQLTLKLENAEVALETAQKRLESSIGLVQKLRSQMLVNAIVPPGPEEHDRVTRDSIQLAKEADEFIASVKKS